MSKKGIWRLGLLFALMLPLIVLSVNIPEAKSPTQIYEEADYSAHIDIVAYHSLYGPGSGNLAGMLIYDHRKNQYFVLTASHFIPKDENVTIREIKISLKGQPGTYSASIYRVNKKLDCALLKIDQIADSDFVFVGRLPQFGSAKNLKQGEPVYSIGSSLGIKFTFGDGIVKNLGVNTLTWGPVILHNADVVPGNSGGPLINKYGKVVGMNVGLHSEYQNFCFAIPIDDILDWLATID